MSGKIVRFPGPRPDPASPSRTQRPGSQSSVDETDPTSRRPAPRPILPRWALHPREAASTARWWVTHALHVAGFQVVRAPKYAARLVALAVPRGLWRAVSSLARYLTQPEARPLEARAIQAGDAASYLELASARRDRMRARLLTVAASSILGITALVMAFLLWPPALLIAAALALAAAGAAGRSRDRPLFEHATATNPRRKLSTDVLIRAFCAAGLAKDTDPISFAAPICRDGAGWLALIDLPYGVKASTALKKREDLAAALDIDEVQVFLSRIRGKDGSARRLSLWVADTDPYATRPPITPLSSIESIDFWKPLPFGLDARQREVELTMVWSSLLIGAIPRMGKTFAARLPAAAAALDPHVRLIVFDGKGGKDWQPLQAVAHRYGSGVRVAVVEHLAHTLQALIEDMNARYETLRTLPHDLCPEGKLTPAASHNRSLRMPLTLVCIDEVQRYLEHPDWGKAILEALIELAKVGPAAGIMLVLATQRPDSKTLPEGLRGQIGTRLALKVMNWQSSETILGAGSYPALDASKLLRSHKGVGILLGADDGEAAEADARIVRTHLMDLPTLQQIVDRGRELRTKAGTLSGVAAGEEAIPENVTPRLLEDVAAVFSAGETKLWSETIVARLAEADPNAYHGWSPTDLASALRPYGIGTHQVWAQSEDGSSANRRGIARDAVLDALAASIDASKRTGDDR